MSDTNFTSGTTIASSWLNDVNDATYNGTAVFTPAGTGAIAKTTQSKLREVVSLNDFLTEAQIAQVASDLATLNTASPATGFDLLAPIQAWIDYVSSTGRLGYVPAGVYKHTGTLVFKNNGRYFGAGAGGSAFWGYGTGDQAQINNPSNTSTASYIVIEGIAFFVPNGTSAGKANLADNGSSILTIRNCSFSNADRLVILDQSEKVLFEKNRMFLYSSSTAVGLWIVDGADRTVGNTAGFTNQILIQQNTFNGSLSGGILIADDGGVDHTYISNNFDRGSNCFRVAGVRGFVVFGGEYEPAGLAPSVQFASTRLNGSAANRVSESASITGGLWVPASTQPVVDVAANSLSALSLLNMAIESSTTGIFTNTNNLAELRAEGNVQKNSGTSINYTINNNYFTSSQFTFTPDLKFNSANVGMTKSVAIGNYQRVGQSVNFQLMITLTAKGSSVGSATITGLPFTSQNTTSQLQACSVLGNNLAAGVANVMAHVNPNTTTINLYKFAAGVVTNLADTDVTNTTLINISGSYRTANLLG